MKYLKYFENKNAVIANYQDNIKKRKEQNAKYKTGDYVIVKHSTGSLNNIWCNYAYIERKYGNKSTIKFVDGKNREERTLNIYNSCIKDFMKEKDIERLELELTTTKYNI